MTLTLSNGVQAASLTGFVLTCPRAGCESWLALVPLEVETGAAAVTAARLASRHAATAHRRRTRAPRLPAPARRRSTPPLDPTAVAIGLCGVGGCALTPHGPKVRHTWERS